MDSMHGDVRIRISRPQEGILDVELWDGERRIGSTQLVKLTAKASRASARQRIVEGRTIVRQRIYEARGRVKERRKHRRHPDAIEVELEAVHQASREFRRSQPANIERFPRLWRLFAFVLPRGIRIESFEPALEDMLAQHLKARRYRTVWARRWLVFAFTFRTVIAVLDCVRLMIVQHILHLLPRRVRDWWTT